jgi:hypothetical protein
MRKYRKFVVQKHQRNSQAPHWDLMLESGGILETYRLPLPPEKWLKEAIETVKIFDHPIRFLSYEGPVNEGKGRVDIADRGTYRIIIENENQRKLWFDGKLLRGQYRFCLTKDDRWELMAV